jgi:hypothetical protein
VSGGLWTAILTNFVFWTGLSAGGVAFAALLDVTGAEWAGPLRSAAYRFRRFLPLSVVLYLLLLAGARAIRVGLHGPHDVWIEHPPGSLWFAFGLVASRDTVALIAATAAAIWSSSNSYDAPSRARAPVVFLIVYTIAFSILTIDLVMSLAAPWGSVLFPAYVLTANVYSAIAAIALAAVWRAGDGGGVLTEGRACDVGKLLFGFALLWMYLVWSQFLVIWYGNLTEEVAYVIVRLYGAWQPLAIATWVARFALPFVVLLPRAGKRRVPVLAVSAIVVAGFWAECFLLIAPDAAGVPSIAAAAAVTAAFAAVFAAATLTRLETVPDAPAQQA